MITNVCVEGIDKSGKGLVAEYIKRLSNHKYTVFDRGVVSEITYSRMFNRNQEFDLEPYKRFLFVHLKVEKDDWKIRCKVNNEPDIDFDSNSNEFNKTIQWFKDNSFYVTEYNTSKKTPWQIAKNVIETLETFNNEKENKK